MYLDGSDTTLLTCFNFWILFVVRRNFMTTVNLSIWLALELKVKLPVLLKWIVTVK
jgi:hypothetical protein